MRRPEPRKNKRTKRQTLRRVMSLQPLETRRVMAAGLPLGATTQDTGEFFLGRVAVTPVFLDSTGGSKTQSWGEGEIDAVLEKITEGLGWWTETLDRMDTVHSLEFVIDDTFANNPLEIPFEPIDQTSNQYGSYVGQFLDDLGVDGSLSLDEGMFVFNSSQREAFGTDWAFSIFIADSSDDPDGFWAPGGSFAGAFAFPGGLYFMAPSTRPTQTFTHEVGHMFWGLDEYAGGGTFSQSRGYYNTPNDNAADNPAPGFVQQYSIMAGGNNFVNGYQNHEAPASTFAMLGWQDSDGDGIFDVLDVPLNFDGTGHFDSQTNQFHFRGNASAATLLNQNPSGPQSDITLNRVSELQVSIDDGAWTTLQSPGTAVASFDFAIDVPPMFSTLSLRVIDAATGVTSAPLTATRSRPIASVHPVSGFVYFDEDGDSVRSEFESLLVGVTLDVRDENGGVLPTGSFAIDDVNLETDIASTDGMTFRATGPNVREAVQVRNDTRFVDQPLIHVFDQSLTRWWAALDERLGLEVEFDQTVGRVEVDVVGLTDDSYARVQAFDANGNLIDRVTTDLRNTPNGSLVEGQASTLVLIDPAGTIASIRVAGHASTRIGVTGVRHGVDPQIVTDASGAFARTNLADGEYQLNFSPTNVTQSIPSSLVTVANGQLIAGVTTTGGLASIAATRVDSPRHNTTIGEDVNGDGSVTALDALQVINDLNANGDRLLTFDELDGFKVDVTNDGQVSALDALRVINKLNELDNVGGGGSGEPLGNTSFNSFASGSHLAPQASFNQNMSNDLIFGDDDLLNSIIGNLV